MNRIVAACLGLVLTVPLASAKAETVQGHLELLWGDPIPAPRNARLPARFLATVVTDDGTRRALDPAQAKRAAGDLYALAGRRVAVEFSTAKRAGGGATIEAIVPADRPGLPATAKALLAPSAVVGNTRWITLACRFSDIADEQKPVSFFSGQYGTSPGQLGHYWNEVSYGKVSLAGSSAYGWFVLPQPRSFYVTTVDGKDKANLNQLFDDCTAAADPTVNFSGAQGINMMFNGDLDGYAWGGGRYAALDGASRAWSTTWNPPWSFSNLAPLAHEMGHGYGLPHSNNSDGDDDTYDNPWDVMSDGWSNAVGNATYGSLPKHINTQQRERLGWIDPARRLSLAVDGAANNVVLDRASLAGSVNRQMIVLSAATGGSTIAYTVEARKRGGAYEAALAGDAVIIHSIDQGGTAYSVDADKPPANVSNNEGSMFKPGETWISADGKQKVKVLSAIAEGFLVRIGNPRVTGGPLLPRTRPSAVALPARVQPASQVAPQRAGRDCANSSTSANAARCKDRIR